MEEVWREGEATVRSVLEALNASANKERAYTTVMTVMAKLDRKGLLTRRRRGKTDVYRPVMSRHEYVEARARAEVGALVDRYGDVALMHFAREMAQLDPKRRDELRRLAGRE
jgi:predicted transcriptional regulator